MSRTAVGVTAPGKRRTYTGFYAAWKLEKKLRRDQAEVVAGSIEAQSDAWAAGDDAGIEDLTAAIPGSRTVPHAQHAVRQGKLLARTTAATLPGRADPAGCLMTGATTPSSSSRRKP